MKKIKLIIFVGTWLLLTQTISADPIVTFFFREYPNAQSAKRTMEKLKRPHGIAKQHLNSLINHNRIAGIFATYFGFLDTSSLNGQIMFPRKQSNPTFQLVVTNKIVPMMMFQNTISHWALEPGTPVAMYSAELKEDEATKLSFWDIQKTIPPENNYISPINSIIIIAKPQNIYVPTGITLTEPSANLILPDIYVKKGINSIRNSLYVLNLNLFFQSVDMLYKKEKTKYEMLINE